MAGERDSAVSQDTAERNREIHRRWKAGEEGCRDIGDEFGLSYQRISQIGHRMEDLEQMAGEAPDFKNLSPRLRKTLIKAGLLSLVEVATFTVPALKERMMNLGAKGLQELEAALAARGLTLLHPGPPVRYSKVAMSAALKIFLSPAGSCLEAAELEAKLVTELSPEGTDATWRQELLKVIKDDLAARAARQAIVRFEREGANYYRAPVWRKA